MLEASAVQLFGFKTEAVFDLWSIEHFLNGISCAAFVGWAQLFVARIKKGVAAKSESAGINLLLNLAFVLALSLFWENVEHYVEAGILPDAWGERVTYWFQGVEHWSNRLIGDNLMVLLGWWAWTKRPSYSLLAKAVSAVWLLVHIFFLPHSMYLQTLLANK